MIDLALENQVSVIGIIASFVGVAVMLGIGVSILGGIALDCSTVSGYNEATPEESDGWALSCIEAQNQTASAYSLLLVILIVVASVSILFVVRLLG